MATGSVRGRRSAKRSRSGLGRLKHAFTHPLRAYRRLLVASTSGFAGCASRPRFKTRNRICRRKGNPLPSCISAAMPCRSLPQTEPPRAKAGHRRLLLPYTVPASKGLLQNCQRRYRGSALNFDAATAQAVPTTEGRNFVISQALGTRCCRYAGPSDSWNRQVATDQPAVGGSASVVEVTSRGTAAEPDDAAAVALSRSRRSRSWARS